jgi:hypothetical protein
MSCPSRLQSWAAGSRTWDEVVRCESARPWGFRERQRFVRPTSHSPAGGESLLPFARCRLGAQVSGSASAHESDEIQAAEPSRPVIVPARQATESAVRALVSQNDLAGSHVLMITGRLASCSLGTSGITVRKKLRPRAIARLRWVQDQVRPGSPRMGPSSARSTRSTREPQPDPPCHPVLGRRRTGRSARGGILDVR